MSAENELERFYEFGPFRVDPYRRLLLEDGDPVPVTPKGFDTLLVLIENRGRVVEKDELIQTLWPDTFVEEVNLAVHVSAIRKALGDTGSDRRYIVTIPKRGYSFVADVCELPNDVGMNGDGAGSEERGDGAGTAPAIAIADHNRLRVGLRMVAAAAAVLLIAVAGLVIAVPDTLSKWVAKAIATSSPNTEVSVDEHRGTESAEAYRAYVKGRYFWNKRSPDGFDKAIKYFNQAIDLDPTYAQAYAGLADCYNVRSFFDGRTPASENFPKAKAAALRALEIDESLAEAHTSLGYALMRHDWDWAGARREFERALELAPDYATAHHWHGELLMLTGDVDGAVAEIRKAVELDPLSPIIRSDLAWAFYFSRQYDRAIRQSRKALELNPNFGPALHCIALSYERKQMYKEAEEAMKRLGLLERHEGGLLFAVSGQKERARRVLADLEARTKGDGGWSVGLAMIHVGLGEREEAFRWLEVACATRVQSAIYLRIDPRFDDLRSDPRFATLLQRIGLPA